MQAGVLCCVVLCCGSDYTGKTAGEVGQDGEKEAATRAVEEQNGSRKTSGLVAVEASES